MTVFTRNDQVGARYCTRFLGVSATGVWATLAQDLSQRRTNIAANAASMQENNTTRMNWMAADGRRTMRAHVTWSTAITGTLFRHGVTNLERWNSPGAGQLRFTINGSNFTFSPPNVSASTQEFIFLWHTFPNPNTTGASDAMRSILVCHNVTTGVTSRFTTTHALKTADNPNHAFIGTTGGSLDWGGTFYRFSYERDYVSLTQTIEDWVTASSEPATDLEQEREWTPFTGAGAGDAGEFYGPAVGHAARTHRQARRRTTSAIINERFVGAPTIQTTTLLGTEWMASPAGDGYRLFLPWTWHRPIPETIDAFWARVHLLSYVTSSTAVPIGVRLYSMDAPPGSPDVSTIHYAGEVVNRDDGSGGNGQWDINDYAPIARDEDGWSYFALGIRIDPNAVSGNDVNARVVVSALHCLPRVVPEQAGALPLG